MSAPVTGDFPHDALSLYDQLIQNIRKQPKETSPSSNENIKTLAQKIFGRDYRQHVFGKTDTFSEGSSFWEKRKCIQRRAKALDTYKTHLLKRSAVIEQKLSEAKKSFFETDSFTLHTLHQEILSIIEEWEDVFPTEEAQNTKMKQLLQEAIKLLAAKTTTESTEKIYTQTDKLAHATHHVDFLSLRELLDAKQKVRPMAASERLSPAQETRPMNPPANPSSSEEAETPFPITEKASPTVDTTDTLSLRELLDAKQKVRPMAASEKLSPAQETRPMNPPANPSSSEEAETPFPITEKASPTVDTPKQISPLPQKSTSHSIPSIHSSASSVYSASEKAAGSSSAPAVKPIITSSKANSLEEMMKWNTEAILDHLKDISDQLFVVLANFDMRDPQTIIELNEYKTNVTEFLKMLFSLKQQKPQDVKIDTCITQLQDLLSRIEKFDTSTKELKTWLDAIEKSIGNIPLWFENGSKAEEIRLLIEATQPHRVQTPMEYGPLPISPETISVQEIAQGMLKDFTSVEFRPVVKENTTIDYTVLYQGKEYSLTELLTKANLSHIVLSAEDFNDYMQFLRRDTLNYPAPSTLQFLVQKEAHTLTDVYTGPEYASYVTAMRNLPVGGKFAINIYTSVAYKPINEMLRGQGFLEDPARVKELFLHTVMAVRTLEIMPAYIPPPTLHPEKNHGLLFRGEGLDCPQSVIQARKEACLTGKISREAGFFSMSYGNVPYSYAKGIGGVLVLGEGSKCVQSFSRYPYEMEVLLPPTQIRWVGFKDIRQPDGSIYTLFFAQPVNTPTDI